MAQIPDISQLCNLPPIAKPDPDYCNKEYDKHQLARYCKKPGCYNGPNAYYPNKNAIVELFLFGQSTEGPRNNGFFINCDCCFYVVTAGTFIQNYININNSAPILARVTNANNTNCTLIYELQIWVYDPNTTVAVLKMAEHSSRNNANGCLTCHPYLTFNSKSRHTPVGSPVYNLWTDNGIQLEGNGSVVHNHYNLLQPYWEVVVASLASFSNNPGSPLLDNFGQVIGIGGASQFLNVGQTFISEFMFKYVLRAALGGPKGQYGGQLVPDNAGVPFWRFQHGYLGLQLSYPSYNQFAGLTPSCDQKIDTQGLIVVGVDPAGSAFPGLAAGGFGNVL
ncbi:MAG: hypothetical protein ACRCU2_17650, partial [Planktothrix sp.]